MITKSMLNALGRACDKREPHATGISVPITMVRRLIRAARKLERVREVVTSAMFWPRAKVEAILEKKETDDEKAEKGIVI